MTEQPTPLLSVEAVSKYYGAQIGCKGKAFEALETDVDEQRRLRAVLQDFFHSDGRHR